MSTHGSRGAISKIFYLVIKNTNIYWAYGNTELGRQKGRGYCYYKFIVIK